jgi:hypothetical protein
VRRRLAIFAGPLLPILRALGFEKKELANDHLEPLQKCEISCRYCSTTTGNTARITGKRRDAAVKRQLGIDVKASSEPDLALFDPRFLDHLRAQLNDAGPTFGRGRTLMVSEFVDPFSPSLMEFGITLQMLTLLFERTEYRIRILTKSGTVVAPQVLNLLTEHRQRVVVGLSFGSLDDKWAKGMEIGAPPPSVRIRALHKLQAANVPTYGMLCPMFPEVLDGQHLERLVDAVRPNVVEHVWAEGYNDRVNWRAVREAYDPGSTAYDTMTSMFGAQDRTRWSAYITALFVRLKAKAVAGGWLHKLRFLLYEGDIVPEDVDSFGDLSGVLLQSKPGPDGRSKHPSFARLQAMLAERK